MDVYSLCTSRYLEKRNAKAIAPAMTSTKSPNESSAPMSRHMRNTVTTRMSCEMLCASRFS
jgi:hypothetical protein